MALGARCRNVIAMILRGALTQIVLGLAIGIPTAYFCVRCVESQLYEIKGLNPAIVLTGIATLVIAAAIAGLIPAQRAASIDPPRSCAWNSAQPRAGRSRGLKARRSPLIPLIARSSGVRDSRQMDHFVELLHH